MLDILPINQPTNIVTSSKEKLYTADTTDEFCNELNDKICSDLVTLMLDTNVQTYLLTYSTHPTHAHKQVNMIQIITPCTQ